MIRVGFFLVTHLYCVCAVIVKDEEPILIDGGGLEPQLEYEDPRLPEDPSSVRPQRSSDFSQYEDPVMTLGRNRPPPRLQFEDPSFFYRSPRLQRSSDLIQYYPYDGFWPSVDIQQPAISNARSKRAADPHHGGGWGGGGYGGYGGWGGGGYGGYGGWGGGGGGWGHGHKKHHYHGGHHGGYNSYPGGGYGGGYYPGGGYGGYGGGSSSQAQAQAQSQSANFNFNTPFGGISASTSGSQASSSAGGSGYGFRRK